MEESPLVNSLLQVLREYETAWNNKLQESSEKIDVLEQELAQLRGQKTPENITEDVTDDVLKGHLLKVKDAPLDMIVQEISSIISLRAHFSKAISYFNRRILSKGAHCLSGDCSPAHISSAGQLREHAFS